MSRARPIAGHWFDMRLNTSKATVEQLELLAAIQDVDIDDLLDATLTQGQVIDRLRQATGHGIPPDVEERRKSYAAERRSAPMCRLCDRVGQSTRHHFVNKWIMKELSNYQEAGSRSKCTIPVCIECHRDLHARDSEAVSIVAHLTERELLFARDLIERLRKEKPALFVLLAEGDTNVYESRLVRDWTEGLFDHVEIQGELRQAA